MIGGLLRRVWPASLYRQILLVAALALFVAQAINMAILLNGARNRSAGEAATLLISRVASQADRQAGHAADWEGHDRDGNERLREGRGAGRRNGRRNGPRIGRGAIVIALDDRRFTPPAFAPEPDFTMRADEILAQSGSDLRDLQLFSGPAKLLPDRLTNGLMQSRFVGRLRQRGERIPHEAILLTAQTEQGQWISAAALVRPAARASIAAMLLQTLTLYIAVLFPLAIVARRIVKPLERLTQRVSMVGLETVPGAGLGAGTGRDLDPLESEGPSDIRKLVESFNAMQARVNGLLGEKDVMLGAIGHDLKTPLAALRVRIESVEDDDEREKMAATIDEMVIILDDILTLARLGKSGEAMQRTDIGALIDSVVDEFVTAGGAAEFLENTLPFENALPLENTLPLENAGPLEKDHRILATIRPVLMRRALRNLIANALKHGGNAAVSVAEARGYIRIKIADNGPGIPLDKMEEIFAPFARLENSRNRATGGSGLGLTIARAIARAHGGDIRLENGAAGGLIAWIELPAERAIA